LALGGQCGNRRSHGFIRVRVRKSAVTVLQNQAYSETFYPETEIFAGVLIENKQFRQSFPRRRAHANLDLRERNGLGNNHGDIAAYGRESGNRPCARDRAGLDYRHIEFKDIDVLFHAQSPRAFRMQGADVTDEVLATLQSCALPGMQPLLLCRGLELEFGRHLRELQQ